MFAIGDTSGYAHKESITADGVWSPLLRVESCPACECSPQQASLRCRPGGEFVFRRNQNSLFPPSRKRAKTKACRVDVTAHTPIGVWLKCGLVKLLSLLWGRAFLPLVMSRLQATRLTYVGLNCGRSSEALSMIEHVTGPEGCHVLNTLY